MLTALAEELKLPLLQIARENELTGNRSTAQTADVALRLIDAYILGLQPANQMSLRLEPVTLSSVLYEVAQELTPIARSQGYDIQVDVGQRLGPVMGERRALHAAFSVLGYELMTAPTDGSSSVLTLGTHRSKNGIVAGIFTDNPLLTTDAFRRAKALAGAARQTLPASSPSNGAGIFIADTLLRNLASSFKIARHHKQTGLAATMLPSKQLQLV